ncbi:hypothetical protein GM418_21670 [Maribellus comscasis]|uniref:NACHT domain-containing protein n=1 Tax=Maribellus comscasis TaxID=2681766 RepID=A0A6I6JYD7_9BACT|nr:hypothetical protein [Maribellus comscasis]QGY46178.1 hypothetical protein GM418_21670 [Maribellus comscasis]
MNQSQLNRLRGDVVEKAGRDIRHQKDCDWLINKIYAETHRQVSSSTIKRFFGLIKSPFHPSRYTQETLLRFLGFKNKEEYLARFNTFEPHTANNDIWEETRRQVMQITNHSLNSLVQKTHYKNGLFVFREFANEHLNNFLESGKTATFFIAPDGFGKSTLLIQLVEKYFLQKDALYKNDIVTLVDGAIFFNLYAKNQNSEILNQLLDFKLTVGTEFYFQNHPEKQKGKLWMIIDDVDDIFFDKKRYHELAENIIRMIMGIDNGNYKVIFSCRPENMDIFLYMAQKTPYLKTCWHGVTPSNYDNYAKTNVPPFERTEIETLLNKFEFPYDFSYLEKYHTDILHIIKNPYFLRLFIESFKEVDTISEIILLKNFLQKRLFSPPYSEDKQILINQFIEICNKGKERNSVLKDKLLQVQFNDFALRELISNGILYEYNVVNHEIQSDTYLKFNQNIVFHFLLLLYWKGNNPLSNDLFKRILNYYANNQKLQCSLLKLFIHLTIHQKNFELIKKILTDIDRNSSDSKSAECLIPLFKTIRDALMANKHVRETLIPWFYTTNTGKQILDKA